MRRRPPRALPILAAAAWLGAAPAAAAERPDDLLRQGYDLAYNLDHDDAVALFERAIEQAPDDPAAYRGIAAITWFRILFLRGGILVDNYLAGSGAAVSRRRVRQPEPPAGLAETFTARVERAIALSEAAVRRAPDDPDAHYELGAAVALAASYRASIEGDVLPALREAKRAYTAHRTVLDLDPRRKDAALILGLYRYLVSLLPRAFRMLAHLVGFDGGKAEALRLIEEAAAYPGDVQPEAQFALTLLYNREREYGGAQRVLGDLKRRFPRNRLVWLESTATWLRAERPIQAERAVAEGFAKLARDGRVRMAGEQAVWRLVRGASRVARGRLAEAAPDLAAAAESEAAWVRGRARVELGKAADLAGDRTRARTAYDQGRKLCRQARHRRCAAAAERLKEQGYSLGE